MPSCLIEGKHATRKNGSGSGISWDLFQICSCCCVELFPEIHSRSSWSCKKYTKIYEGIDLNINYGRQKPCPIIQIVEVKTS